MNELEALTLKAQTKRETQETYVATVFAALDEGFSPAEIARAANTSRQAIAQLAKRHGKTFPSMRKGVAWGVERNAEEVQRAQRIVTNAKERGRLIPEPCEVCGETAEAHHDDYAKPLEIRWLCRLHHQRHHRNEAKS